MHSTRPLEAAMQIRRLGWLTLTASMALAACAGSAVAPSTAGATGVPLASARAVTPTSLVTPTQPPAASASPTPSATPVPALVGEWKGMHDCAVVVAALKEFGFATFVNSIIIDDGLIPGVTDPATLVDPQHPCLGSVSFVHYHFFRADGQFGSLDEHRQQVDDGLWAIVDAKTFRIGDVPFGYQITGDKLTLTPMNVTDDCMVGTWCQQIWKLMVSMPGTTWTRSG
jgi:hypothetical protein